MLGSFYYIEQYFGPGRGCSYRKRIYVGKSAESYLRVPQDAWSGISVRETKHEVSFGLVARNEDFYLPILKHRKLIALRSGAGTRTEYRFELSTKLGVPGESQEIKFPWLNPRLFLIDLMKV